MRNIWRIIKADARSLFTHFFALAVALAIAVLPSLYAWLNIYSNWDPYGNTGNISIAVASLDKGWTEEDGTQVNKGREVVDDLRTSTSINWVIVDTKEEAQQGVHAGDYYAAVVIGQDFSYNMYHMLTEWTGKPTITYYENYKKNAVATKITDTAVSSLKTTISKSYLDVVVDAIFRGANDLSQQLSQEDPVGSVQGLLGQTRSLLRSCAKTIGLIKAINTFRADKNIKLATYASRCIENEILMYLRKNAGQRTEVSFDEPLNTDWDGKELLLSDVLGTEGDVVMRPSEADVDRKLLSDAVARLSPREKDIISLRFGLGGRKELTQKEVADRMGISQSYISRLEKRIISRLRRDIQKMS